MAMFNLSDFLAMTRAKAKSWLAKRPAHIYIKYLVSFQLLQGDFLSVLPYLLRCGCRFFTYTPSLEKEKPFGQLWIEGFFPLNGQKLGQFSFFFILTFSKSLNR